MRLKKGTAVHSEGTRVEATRDLSKFLCLGQKLKVDGAGSVRAYGSIRTSQLLLLLRSEL